MSYADFIFKTNLINIAMNGEDDYEENVRAKWEDGIPAHTVACVGLVNVYNLEEEFPIMTLRKINWKAALDEILWIWQKKSNNVKDLNSHIWDAWANEDGSIGKAYGYQMGKVIDYGNGLVMDQVDKVLYDLKNNPASRRIQTEMYVHEDLKDMNLAPCCHHAQFIVKKGKLNLVLKQRSQDMLVANNWNVIQYAFLVHMLAQVSGLKVGKLTHVIGDAHLYDRHSSIAEKIVLGDPKRAPRLLINDCVTDFYKFTVDDFELDNYRYSEPDIGKIPVAI